MQSSTVQPPAGMVMPFPNDEISVPQSNLKKTGNGAVHRILSGNRLHLQHGPIDLIIVVDGTEQVQNEAFDRAIHRFDPILEELVTELPILKTPWNPSFPNLKGRVAKRMLEAVQGLDGFITPMAAVAGAVADEIRDVMLEVPGIRRLMVNNGGDIAFDLTPGTECRFGVFELKEAPELSTTVGIDDSSPVRGVATSGWRGRSQSLGIADSVTVLARSAAQADASATLVANAVNVDHPDIVRVPASQLVDDSDLELMPVTAHVPKIPKHYIDRALENGSAMARNLQQAGRLEAAYLSLQHQTRVINSPESRS